MSKVAAWKAGWDVKCLDQIGVAQTGSTPGTADEGNFGDFIPFSRNPDSKRLTYIIESQICECYPSLL